MNSRETILQRIRTALADRPQVDPPPVPDVWPRENPDTDTMFARFAKELADVQGEVHRCASMADAQATFQRRLAELGCESLGGVETPLARQLTEPLGDDRVAWTRPGWKPDEMAQLAAGLVTADYLIADTGTCMVANATSEQRLMCYLPPVCFVIARTDQLREHLPAAWDEVASRAADPELRGEFVFITGPSRTADIEKILILGVHGPKQLIVLVVD